jgi:hypothetical protein
MRRMLDALDRVPSYAPALVLFAIEGLALAGAVLWDVLL